MKTIRFAGFLFYRYYSKGSTKDIRYFSTLTALVMLLMLHVFQVMVLLDQRDFLPTDSSNSKGSNFLIIAIMLVPIYIIMALAVKEADLKKAKYSEVQISRGNLFLILYIVLSMAFLAFLTVYA